MTIGHSKATFVQAGIHCHVSVHACPRKLHASMPTTSTVTSASQNASRGDNNNNNNHNNDDSNILGNGCLDRHQIPPNSVP